MRTLLTSIIIAAGLAVSSPADAHPPQTGPSVEVRLVWVWVPAHVHNGIQIRGQWRHVQYGTHAHLRHRHYRPVVRHVRVPRGHHQHRHHHPRRRR